MSLSQKMQAKEAQLRSLYSHVFDAFRNIDTSTSKDHQRDALPLLRKSLEPVETISLVQIAAVMDAINSGKLELFFSQPGPGFPSVGNMLRQELKSLGLSVFDLQRFLEEQGYRGDLAHPSWYW
jgi:hypothetical protein